MRHPAHDRRGRRAAKSRSGATGYGWAVSLSTPEPVGYGATACESCWWPAAGGGCWCASTRGSIPETADQRQALAEAASALGQADRVSMVCRTLRRTVKRTCGSPATLLVTSDASEEEDVL